MLIEGLGFRFQMDSYSFTGLVPFSLTNSSAHGNVLLDYAVLDMCT